MIDAIYAENAEKSTIGSQSNLDLAEVRKLVVELSALFQIPGSYDCARELYGREAVRDAFDSLRRDSREEIRSYHSPPFSSPLPTSGEDDIGMRALSRGVRIRILASTAVLGEPDGVAHLLNGKAAGWDVRLLTDVPMKLLIADDSAALLSKTDRSSGVRTVLIYSSLLLDVLISGFEVLWSLATPICSQRELSDLDTQLTALDHQILLLLAAGATDEVIARTLFLSRRTVQRHMTMLLTRLGATSRFQAGVNAAKRGWL